MPRLARLMAPWRLRRSRNTTGSCMLVGSGLQHDGYLEVASMPSQVDGRLSLLIPCLHSSAGLSQTRYKFWSVPDSGYRVNYQLYGNRVACKAATATSAIHRFLSVYLLLVCRSCFLKGEDTQAMCLWLSQAAFEHVAQCSNKATPPPPPSSRTAFSPCNSIINCFGAQVAISADFIVCFLNLLFLYPLRVR